MDPRGCQSASRTRLTPDLVLRRRRDARSCGTAHAQHPDRVGRRTRGARFSGREAPTYTMAPTWSFVRVSTPFNSRASNSSKWARAAGWVTIPFTSTWLADAYNTYVKDLSINESMTRWIVLHSTQGVTLERNVGYKSIGHGFYLEDGTETDNKFHSNIGIFARAAVDNQQNPRKVPGILADNSDEGASAFPYLPTIDYPIGVLDHQRLERFHRQHGGRGGDLRRVLLVGSGDEQRHPDVDGGNSDNGRADGGRAT